MATIPELVEDFTGAAAGQPIATSDTKFTAVYGAGASTFVVDPLDSTRQVMQVSLTADPRTHEITFPGVANLWFRFDLDIDTPLGTNTAILNGWDVAAGTNKVFDVRQNAGARTIELRNVSTSVWTSSPLASGTTHRIYVHVNLNTGKLQCLIYSGGDFTTLSQDSGVFTPNTAATTIGHLRMGAMTAATGVIRIGALRGDDSTQPFDAAEGGPSVNDTMGLSDAGFDVTFGQTLSDQLGLTDSITAAVTSGSNNKSVTLADTLGLTDSLTATRSRPPGSEATGPTTPPPVQAGFSAWANGATGRQSDTHPDANILHTGNANAYIHTPVPVPAGADLAGACPLRIHAHDDTDAGSLTIRRVVEGWKQRTLNFKNKPATTDTDKVTVNFGPLSEGDVVEADVQKLLAPIVAGTAKNYGFEITGSVGKWYSAAAGHHNPTLQVTYEEPSDAPTPVRPDGLVGVTQPTLQWDTGRKKIPTSYQVQADPAYNEDSPAYDSGTVTSADSMHALAGTDFEQLSSDGDSTQWRVRYTAGGRTSDWSDWVTMTRDDKGVGAINSPVDAPNNVVWEPTPEVLFGLTGETLQSFHLWVTPAGNHDQHLHSSGVVTTPDGIGSYTLPAKADTRGPLIVAGRSYALGVRMHDGKPRVGSLANGDEPYVEIWKDFTLTDDVGVTAPTLASVTQAGDTPAVDVTLTRGNPPDSFVLVVDGEERVIGIDPATVYVTGTTYTIRYWGASPFKAHTYQVRAVEAGSPPHQSQKSNSVSATTKIEGVWLCNPDTGSFFRLINVDGISEWKQTEVSVDFLPLGARVGYSVTQSLGGLAGPATGDLKDWRGLTLDAMEADLWEMKAAAPYTQDFRLVADELNIPVQARNITCSVHELGMPGNRRKRAGFTFTQSGEFEFEGLV